jgi:hypothetical protein
MDPRSRYDDICDALTAWHPPPVPPNPLHSSPDGDRRLRHRVVVPPEQAGAWEELAYTALGQDHSVPPA